METFKINQNMEKALNVLNEQPQAARGVLSALGVGHGANNFSP
jgi:hypothetical protein